MAAFELRRRRRLDEEHRWKLSLFREFVAKHGWEKLNHRTVVPPGVRIYTWAHNRRQDYRNGEIVDWLVPELESIPGWSWFPNRDRLRDTTDNLRRFVRLHGWEGVTYELQLEGVPVAVWLAARRQEYRKGKLAPWLARRLEAIPGWSWQPRDEHYSEMLVVLREHVRRHGWDDFRQETLARSGERIGRWANHIRVVYRKGKLPAAVVSELEAIPGWTWEPLIDRHMRKIYILRAFAVEQGWEALRANTVVDGVKLGVWVTRCRASKRAGSLPDWLARELGSIPGWRW